MSYFHLRVSARSAFLLGCALLAVLAVVLIDSEYLRAAGYGFRDAPPGFTGVYILRMFLSLVGSLLFVYALMTLKAQNEVSSANHDRNVSSLIVWLTLLLSTIFLYVFLYDPQEFSLLAVEDGPIEMLSALLHFISCGIFIYVLLVVLRSATSHRSYWIVGSVGFIIFFFVSGMEEISWFQRILSLETPAILQDNGQGELNLHNFATNKIEIVFYFGSFVFLIVLPFFIEQVPRFVGERFSFFLPSRFVLFVGAIFTAYNYDMWNIVLMQFAFFATLIILFYYAFVPSSRVNRLLVLSMIAVCVITQVLFLFYGYNFVRLWDVTEYRELLIPLAFLVYSWEILQKAKRIDRPLRV